MIGAVGRVACAACNLQQLPHASQTLHPCIIRRLMPPARRGQQCTIQAQLPLPMPSLLGAGGLKVGVGGDHTRDEGVCKPVRYDGPDDEVLVRVGVGEEVEHNRYHAACTWFSSVLSVSLGGKDVEHSERRKQHVLQTRQCIGRQAGKQAGLSGRQAGGSWQARLGPGTRTDDVPPDDGARLPQRSQPYGF